MGVPTISYKTPEPLMDVQAARLPWHGATAPESWHNRRLLWHRGARSAPREATLQQAISVLGSEWGHRKKLLCVSFPLPIKFPLSPSGDHPWVTIPAYGVPSSPSGGRPWVTTFCSIDSGPPLWSSSTHPDVPPALFSSLAS